jgi:molybdate transport system regulatory protein
MAATTRLTLRIDFDDHRRLGPGKIRLLELIGEHGSISAASRLLGMSYRRAWSLVGELNDMFAEPVLNARTGGAGGGSASLTEYGREVVRAYRAIEANAATAAAPDLHSLKSHLRAPRKAPRHTG